MIKQNCSAEPFYLHCFRYLGGLFLCFTPLAHSAGIAIMEQSVKELGQAFSGAPTNFTDASMVFFNPAAMSQIRGKLVSTAGYVIAPSAVFHDSASQLSPALGGVPLSGNNGGNSPDLVSVPNVYFVQELTPRLAFGFGFNSPYGMRNSYQPDWKGRYQALDSELLTLNFNPSLSFKVTERLSVGAGFNVQYLDTKLTNAIDFGTICLPVLGPITCAGQGLLPQSFDGHVSLNGDSVGFGYNFGAFYTLNQNTRFGVSYRSRITHDVHGHANFSVPDNASALTLGGSFIDTKTRTSVTLPDSVLFGFSHRMGSHWEVSADALWTHWSLIRELRTDFLSAQRDDVMDLRWKDTWRLAAGINYFSEDNKWIFRTGFAYDQTPVPDSLHRSPRIPDNDRYWLTAGVTYALFRNITLHAAYAHLFMGDAAINHRGTTGDFLIGQYAEQINIGGLQMDWRF
ncbi:MAG: aromatic hydrocarbon degradation protein [Nitrosomonas sp.]|nr:MAG: aromatic hydrocarbon degradation protein [Nitrosomonas sp.]